MPEENIEQPSINNVRSDEFVTCYANNIQFESSIWDLKLLFGQVDFSAKPVAIEQHTAIAIPWLQAKLLAYYLLINIHIFEAENGKVAVPSSVAPQIPEAPTEDQRAVEFREVALGIRREILGIS